MSAVALVSISYFVGKPVTLYFLIWLLGAGVQLLEAKKAWSGARHLAWLSVLLFIVTSAYVRGHPIPQYTADVLLGVITAAMIYGCLQQREIMHAGLYSRCSKFLSDMSYTLYLVHLPAFVFVSGNAPASVAPLASGSNPSRIRELHNRCRFLVCSDNPSHFRAPNRQSEGVHRGRDDIRSSTNPRYRRMIFGQKSS